MLSDFGNGHSKLLYMFSRHVCRSTSVEESADDVTGEAAEDKSISLSTLEHDHVAAAVARCPGEAINLYSAETVRRASTRVVWLARRSHLIAGALRAEARLVSSPATFGRHFNTARAVLKWRPEVVWGRD